jgi:excinuclease UvrABC nuclease subunit
VPISARWRRLTALPPPRGRDAQPGVYELADAGKTLIYIGQSAKDVPNRIRQHLGKNPCITERAVYWRSRYSRVPQTEEAALLADYQQRHEALPPCNRANQRVRDTKKRYLERSRSS